MRFPIDFETQFTNPICTAVSGFATTGLLDCTYVPSVRLLSITTGFPTIFNPTEVVFIVSGVTNPKYATQSAVFTVDSYTTSSNEFILLESSSPTITVTPSAGALGQESLALSDSTVGTYSTLTASL